MAENDEQETHENIRQFYDDVYYESVQEKVTVSRHLHKLAAKLHISQGQTVLDIACGTGDWLMATVARGAQPTGLDISQKAVDVCKLNMPNGRFHCGVAETLPFSDTLFDIVSCLGSIEHFVDPLQAIQEMVRVAKPDAQFLFLVPNADFLTAKLGLYSGTNQVDAKEDVRTIAGWERLFEAAGLTINKKWRDLHVLNWAWINSGRWTAVPVRALQAMMLPFWPLRWQYQVYFLCHKYQPN